MLALEVDDVLDNCWESLEPHPGPDNHTTTHHIHTSPHHIYITSHHITSHLRGTHHRPKNLESDFRPKFTITLGMTPWMFPPTILELEVRTGMF